MFAALAQLATFDNEDRRNRYSSADLNAFYLSPNTHPLSKLVAPYIRERMLSTHRSMPIQTAFNEAVHDLMQKHVFCHTNLIVKLGLTSFMARNSAEALLIIGFVRIISLPGPKNLFNEKELTQIGQRLLELYLSYCDFFNVLDAALFDTFWQHVMDKIMQAEAEQSCIDDAIAQTQALPEFSTAIETETETETTKKNFHEDLFNSTYTTIADPLPLSAQQYGKLFDYSNYLFLKLTSECTQELSEEKWVEIATYIIETLFQHINIWTPKEPPVAYEIFNQIALAVAVSQTHGCDPKASLETQLKTRLKLRAPQQEAENPQEQAGIEQHRVSFVN